MRDSYGVFCGHHNDAVGLYKDQLQNNKKFQNLIRVRSPRKGAFFGDEAGGNVSEVT